jgi:OOP family OmpA-OmpF porin
VNSPVAIAADDNWYLGGSIGQSRSENSHPRITSQLGGATVTSIDDDSTDVGYKLFGGKKFNRNFAIEGGYFDLGKFGFTANTTGPGTFSGTIKLKGVNVDALGILPITDKFSAFGRVGLQYAQAKDSFTGTGPGAAVAASNPSPSKNSLGYKFGVGVQYDFTQSLGLRGEWERYRIDDAVGNKGDVDMYLVGVVYTFGHAEKPAPRAEPAYVAPVAVAAAPAPVPEPVLVIVPVVLTQQYCSILDIQFEINANTVQRESEEKIDKVGIFMKKYPKTTAVIEGHTDEVGTAAENMKLSERRAEGVVTYLANHGIDRSRLKSVGYGETRPIGDNRTQVGKRLNRRINAVIACATDIEGILPIPERITMAMELEFDRNSAAVRPQYREELRKVANFMKANPRVTATVEGHTGNLQATKALAMEISQRRAQNVTNYLVTEFGISRSRLTAEGFGQTRRFAYNTSLEGQQENRRVNIVLDFPN